MTRSIRGRIALVSGLFAALLLAGCGGGGGGGATASTLKVTISTPYNGFATSAASVTVDGTFVDAVSISVNGVAGTLNCFNANCIWVVNGVSLNPGSNTLTATVRNGAGDSVSAHVAVWRDIASPTIVVVSPLAASITASTSITVRGTAADDLGIQVLTVAGVGANTSDGYATWTADVPVNGGSNLLTATARDLVGNTTSASITVTRDVAPPTVAVVFPPVASLTTGTTIKVRGSAADDASVSGVTVAGVAATSSDGFATWTVVVPVSAFAGAVTAVATDAVARTSAAATVPMVTKVADFLHRPTNIVFDTATSSILVSDHSLDSVLRIAASNGATTIVSSPAVGSGPRFVSPGFIVSAPGAAYVVDYGLDVTANSPAIVRVDLVTGARAIVSSTAVGSGPLMNIARSVGYDTLRDRVLVHDFILGSPAGVSQILAVDPATGTRTLISGNGVGVGAALPNTNVFTAIDYDAANDRYVLFTATISTTPLVTAIDPITGDRTALSSNVIGTGPLLNGTRSAVVASGTSAYVLVSRATVAGSLVHVDLTTGNRTAVDMSALGTLPPLRSAMSLARDPGSGELFIGDSQAGRIYGVALSSKTVASAFRTVVGDSVRIGSGPELMFPQKIALDLASGKGYVTDQRENAVFALDLVTGARSVVSSNASSLGVAFIDPYTVTLDSANARLLVSDYGLGIVEVSLADGSRSLLYDDSSSFLLDQADDALLDAARNRLLISNGSATPPVIYAMELSSNALTTAVAGTAPAPAIANFGAMAHRANSDSILVTDYSFSLYDVNPVNTARALVSAGVLPLSFHPIAGVATDGTSAWIVNGQYNRIQRIDLSTGVATTQYDGATSAVPGSSPVGGVGFDEARGLIYWIDAGIRGLTVVDGYTGERVIISR